MDSARPSTAPPSSSRLAVDPVVDRANRMRCPKCGDEQEKSDICVECGVVVEKFLRIQQDNSYQPSANSGVSYMNDVDDGISPQTIKAMAATACMGIALLVIVYFL